MNLQQQLDAWHTARATVEAALLAGYDFKRDKERLEASYVASFQALKQASIELRNGRGEVRGDVHEMMATATNDHRRLRRRLGEAKLIKQRRRSQIERRILDEVEPYWLRDQSHSQS
jgi:hypothetical protein